jgi:hypothetical protein
MGSESDMSSVLVCCRRIVVEMDFRVRPLLERALHARHVHPTDRKGNLACWDIATVEELQ